MQGIALEATIQSQRKKEIVEYCNSLEQFIDKESVALLENEEHWKEIISSIEGTVISSEKVKQRLAKHDSKLSGVKEVVVKKSAFTGNAKDIDSDFRIMREYEVTDQSSSEGKVKDFLDYFTDKYNFLHGLFSKRAGFAPKAFDRLKGVKQYEEVDIIGMVMKKWVSKNGNLTIELDSPEGRFIAIVSKEDNALNRDAGKVLLDDVIGIKGKKFSDEVLIVKMILWPDLIQRQPKTGERDVSVMLISDIHVGSRLFMEKEFTNFLSWLNGNASSEKELERIGKIKYMVIAGDNVDGVGVYPDQINELSIKDIYGQYEKLGELIREIPEHIEIFMCPGQHDAVRRADPQPAIPKEFIKNISDLGNVHMVGSPSWVEIEGFKSMIYHGASHHDMYMATKHLNSKEPQLAMIELLRRRDLSTGFGLTQPYVPEKRDFMLIREEPDFYFAGDMHHKGYAQYKGCMCVNAGTWQERTDYQIRMGHIPTPGIAIDINLKTRKLTENNFAGGSEENGD